MTPRARLAVFALAAAGLAALLVWGLAGLPRFGDYEGRYGRIIARDTVPQRKATDAVGVTTFDYRGIDTLGEEFILLVSVVGVMALLRAHREETDESRGPGELRPSRGYKVNTQYKTMREREGAARQQQVAAVIAQAMRRLKRRQ